MSFDELVLGLLVLYVMGSVVLALLRRGGGGQPDPWDEEPGDEEPPLPPGEPVQPGGMFSDGHPPVRQGAPVAPPRPAPRLAAPAPRAPRFAEELSPELEDDGREEGDGLPQEGSAPDRAASAALQRLVRLDRRAVLDGILLREILGPPRALRPYRPPPERR